MKIGIFATLYWQVDWDVVEDIDNILRKHTNGQDCFDMPVTIGKLPATAEEIEACRKSSAMPFRYDNQWYVDMFKTIRVYWDAGEASKVLFV